MRRVIYILISFLVAALVHVFGVNITESIYNSLELYNYAKFDFFIDDNYYILLDLAIYLFLIELLKYVFSKKNILYLNFIKKSDLNGKIKLNQNSMSISCSILRDPENKIPKGTKLFFYSDHIELSMQGISGELFNEEEKGITFYVFEALKNSQSCNFSFKVIQKPSSLDGVVTKIRTDIIKKKSLFRKTITKINDIEFSCVRR